MGRASASRTGRGLPADHRRAPALEPCPTSMMVVVDGKLFGYGALDRPSIVYSVRKSILAMLYGRYVDSGVIDLDRTLGELGIDDTGGLLPVERRRGCGTCWHRARACTTRPPIPATMPTMCRRAARRNPAATSSTTTGTSMRRAPLSRWRRPGYLRGVRARHRGSAAPLHGRLPTVEPAHPNVASRRHPAYHFLLSTRHEPPGPAHASARALGRAAQLIPQDWVDAMLRPVTPAAQMHARTAERAWTTAALWCWTPSSSPLAGAYMAGLLRPVHSRGARTPDGHRPQADVKPGGGDVARVRPANSGAGAHVRRRGLPMIGKRFACRSARGITDIVARQVGGSGRRAGPAGRGREPARRGQGDRGATGGQRRRTATDLHGTVGTQVVNPLIYRKLAYDADSCRSAWCRDRRTCWRCGRACRPRISRSSRLCQGQPGQAQFRFGRAGKLAAPGVELKMTAGLDIVHVPFKAAARRTRPSAGRWTW